MREWTRFRWAGLVVAAIAVPAAAQVRYDRGGAFEVGHEPTQVAIADMNGDHIPDILCANTADDFFSFFLGRIDPVTRDWLGTPVDQRNERGDETGGGYGGGGGGNGGGNDPSVPGFPTRDGLADILVFDVNRDGKPDVIVAEETSRTVSTRTGSNDGKLSSPRPFFSAFHPFALDAADVNANGYYHVVAACREGVCLFFTGRDSGIHGSRGISIAAAGAVVAADVADLDGIGAAEILVLVAGPAGGTAPAELVVLSLDAGSIAPNWRSTPVRQARSVIDPALRGVSDFKAADLDGDGLVELIFAGTDGTIVVKSGLEGAPSRFDAFGAISSLEVADMNGDGLLDVVTSNSAPTSSFGVLLSDGHGGFAEPLLFQTGIAAKRLAVADVDRDRALDVVVPAVGFDPAEPGSFELHFDRTAPAFGGGTVNAGAGEITDVLFVNGSAGGPARTIELAVGASVAIDVAAPPSETSAAYAIFGWPTTPAPSTGYLHRFGMGSTCLPTPLTGGSPQPTFVWNATGLKRLGASTAITGPAPTRLLDLVTGFDEPLQLFVQGIIADAGSAARVDASITNGVLIDVR